eukprot:scaffold67902_cov22-Tisochrysis_lutea.AAC.1
MSCQPPTVPSPPALDLLDLPLELLARILRMLPGWSIGCALVAFGRRVRAVMPADDRLDDVLRAVITHAPLAALPTLLSNFSEALVRERTCADGLALK